MDEQTRAGMSALRVMAQEVREAELHHATSPVRIRVTRFAFPGSIVETPEHNHDGEETGRFEVRVHPDDWSRIVETAEKVATATQRGIVAMWGIPVLIEDPAIEDPT